MQRFISFKPTMAQAILDDRKTQTRRLIKPQPTKLPDGWWQWVGQHKENAPVARESHHCRLYAA
jgi:hypothetical protein